MPVNRLAAVNARELRDRRQRHEPGAAVAGARRAVLRRRPAEDRRPSRIAHPAGLLRQVEGVQALVRGATAVAGGSPADQPQRRAGDGPGALEDEPDRPHRARRHVEGRRQDQLSDVVEHLVAFVAGVCADGRDAALLARGDVGISRAGDDPRDDGERAQRAQVPVVGHDAVRGRDDAVGVDERARAVVRIADRDADGPRRLARGLDGPPVDDTRARRRLAQRRAREHRAQHERDQDRAATRRCVRAGRGRCVLRWSSIVEQSGPWPLLSFAWAVGRCVRPPKPACSVSRRV